MTFIDLDDAAKARDLRQVADFFTGYTGVGVGPIGIAALQGILCQRAEKLDNHLRAHRVGRVSCATDECYAAARRQVGVVRQ